MLEQVVNLIKGAVANNISNNQSIPNAQKGQVTETVVSSLLGELKDHFSLGNITQLQNLFEGSSGSEGIIKSLEDSVSNALTQKLGLSQNVIAGIVPNLVQSVINEIKGKIGDPNEKGFSLDSFLSIFKHDGNDSGNSFLGAIGNLFK